MKIYLIVLCSFLVILLYTKQIKYGFCTLISHASTEIIKSHCANCSCSKDPKWIKQIEDLYVSRCVAL